MKHANIAIFIPHIGCPNQCSFCNQHTISGQQNPPSASEVFQTCEEALSQIKNPQNTEIAFFGGSFTAIERSYMLELLEAVQPFIGEGKFKGIRISTRPDAIDIEILNLLEKYNVTAVELGVQSMNDEILRKNYRGHTSKDVENAVNLLRNYPFELGLQFMPGLYGDTEDSIRDTARKIADLMPDTVRIYPTLVLKDTKLAEWFVEGLYQPLDLNLAVSLTAEFLRLFESRGISVIRVGLHASSSMEEELLAGPYHQAFRELCESYIYLDLAKNALAGKEKNKKYSLFVNKSEVSKLVGQHKKNILDLQKDGFNLKVIGVDYLPKRTVIAEEVCGEGSV